MKLTSRIAKSHLSSRHVFSFIKFSTVLSIIGLSIGVASLIIISSITNGFRLEVNKKLSNIDGHFRIENYVSDSIPINELPKIKQSLNLLSLSFSINFFFSLELISCAWPVDPNITHPWQPFSISFSECLIVASTLIDKSSLITDIEAA